MKKTETMNNERIYAIAEMLLKEFSAEEDKMFPAMPLFALRKNIKTFTELAQEIEKVRMDIIQKYGKPSEEDSNRYVFDDSVVETVNKELVDLISIEQEVSYYTIKIKDLANIELTSGQMDAIITFIEDEEE